MWWIAVVGLALTSCGPGGSDLDACLAAEHRHAIEESDRCESAWQSTFDERAASAGARLALMANDERAMFRWAARATNDLEGARILHFLGSFQVRHGDVVGAESSFRRALALRIDREPLRAANTAGTLFDLIRNRAPAEQSIELLQVAWQQASLAHDPLERAMAATSLIQILLDLGEIQTAQFFAHAIDGEIAPAWRDLSDGRVEAARGRFALAASLLARAATEKNSVPWPDDGTLDAVEAYVGSNQIAQARTLLDRGANKTSASTPTLTIETECAVAAVRGHLEMAEGQASVAYRTTEHALAGNCPERLRGPLLELEGDALAELNRPVDSENAWRAAADSLESWRLSLSSSRLRTGLVFNHRRALERWLDSAGARGDTVSALAAAQRLLARELLARLLDREPTRSANPDVLFADLLTRIGDGRALATHTEATSKLANYDRDIEVFLEGARSIWLLRHGDKGWSIVLVDDRDEFTQLADMYRKSPDDREVASALGARLFSTVPLNADVPLVILTDHDLADLALASLRVNGRFLVELAQIIEPLDLDLLFETMPATEWQAPVVVGDPRGDLAGASQEARAVGHALGVAPLISHQATRAAVFASLHPSVLHLATHSTTVDDRAEVALADADVSTREILDERLAPRLAVVATCRSDGGDDPLSSVVAAFLASGTPGVIGTKRAVDDRETEQLVSDFYTANGATDPVRALAIAQRRAIVVGRPPHEWGSISFFGIDRWRDRKEPSP